MGNELSFPQNHLFLHQKPKHDILIPKTLSLRESFRKKTDNMSIKVEIHTRFWPKTKAVVSHKIDS